MNILSNENKEALVLKLAALMRDFYAFPEAGAEMCTLLEQHWHDGLYAEVESSADLCRKLTEDLRTVERDYHLSVYEHPGQAAMLREAEKQKSDAGQKEWALTARENYGFKAVKHLAGNVGYVDIRQFPPVEQAHATAAAMMAYLQYSDALIFDLRLNGGGDNYLVQFIESYLFDEVNKLLLTQYERKDQKVEEYRVLPVIPGKRMPDVPVYILTSGITFSGGEDFAYTLKHHQRAIVVGETTGGGANPVDFKLIAGDFIVCLPIGYPKHPVTGENWEGSGVLPDIAVPREKALESAHLAALDVLIQRSEDENEQQRLIWAREEAQAGYVPLKLAESVLRSYTGTYGSWEIKLKNGSLLANRVGRNNDWALIPVAENRFLFDGDRIIFEKAEGESDFSLVFLMDYGKRSARIRKT